MRKFSLSCEAGWGWGKIKPYGTRTKTPSFGPAPPHCHPYDLNNSQSHFLLSHPTWSHRITLTLTLIHSLTHPHLHSYHVVVAICQGEAQRLDRVKVRPELLVVAKTTTDHQRSWWSEIEKGRVGVQDRRIRDRALVDRVLQVYFLGLCSLSNL